MNLFGPSYMLLFAGSTYRAPQHQASRVGASVSSSATLGFERVRSPHGGKTVLPE
jgi:hypothetical protein